MNELLAILGIALAVNFLLWLFRMAVPCGQQFVEYARIMADGTIEHNSVIE